MILVDSSVWIDSIRGIPTPQTARLRELDGDPRLAVGDLILAEVLQGSSDDIRFARHFRILTSFPIIDIAGRDVAVQAAQNYRALRARGVTARGTIDTLIATRCIMDGHALLFSDRDFAPFVEHLGLRDAMNG